MDEEKGEREGATGLTGSRADGLVPVLSPLRRKGLRVHWLYERWVLINAVL